MLTTHGRTWRRKPNARRHVAHATVCEKTVKLVGNLVEFGNRSDLRKALGLIKGDIRQAHHLVAWELRNHPIIQMVARNASKATDFSCWHCMSFKKLTIFNQRTGCS